ncbi:hypothetical protein ACWEN3_36525, partial [Streptomyces sp. NPDC004561]
CDQPQGAVVLLKQQVGPTGQLGGLVAKGEQTKSQPNIVAVCPGAYGTGWSPPRTPCGPRRVAQRKKLVARATSWLTSLRTDAGTLSAIAARNAE